MSLKINTSRYSFEPLKINILESFLLKFLSLWLILYLLMLMKIVESKGSPNSWTNLMLDFVLKIMKNWFLMFRYLHPSLLGGTSGREIAANAGDLRDSGLIPGSGRSPGKGHGNPLQYSHLGNPMDRGAWQATVYGVAKSQTRLKQLSTMLLWVEYGIRECVGNSLPQSSGSQPSL